MDIQKLINEAKKDGGKNLLSKLSEEDTKKLNAVLSDKAALSKLLSSDKAKQIMEKLNNG
ncbi:MAG: hypothetical protein U0M42_03235 [Acutalibacteraceae bacterium]|nr:hypothetical protein [Acutalibacteraceae bacterium]